MTNKDEGRVLGLDLEELQGPAARTVTLSFKVTESEHALVMDAMTALSQAGAVGLSRSGYARAAVLEKSREVLAEADVETASNTMAATGGAATGKAPAAEQGLVREVFENAGEN